MLDLNYNEFVLNDIVNYWSNRAWRPNELQGLERSFGFEIGEMKELRLLEKGEFDSIFTDIIYSKTSISAFDKEIVDYFIERDTPFNFSKMSFKEILAFVGHRLLDNPKVTTVLTKYATNILRFWVAYSAGD